MGEGERGGERVKFNMSMEDRDPNQMGKTEINRNEELLCSYRIYQGLLTASQLLHSEANAF